MSKTIPAVEHWAMELGDVDALISLYKSTQIADLPENWRSIMLDQLDVMWMADNAAKGAHSLESFQAAPDEQLASITLPEVIQCFKTLVHFDWVQELGRDLVADGVLDIPYEDYWVTKWPLDEPYARGYATGVLDNFLRWWPIWCGHDVMTGPLGKRNSNYYSIMAPVYRAVLIKITYDDLHMALDVGNLGGVVDSLRRYGAQR